MEICPVINIVMWLNTEISVLSVIGHIILLMFKAFNGIAQVYLSDRIVMNCDVNGYDTRGSNIELYHPTMRTEAFRNSLMYMSGKLLNDLPDIETFKRN